MGISDGPARLTRDPVLARARAEAAVALLAGTPSPARIVASEHSDGAAELRIERKPFADVFDLCELGPVLMQIRRGRNDAVRGFVEESADYLPFMSVAAAQEQAAQEREVAAASTRDHTEPDWTDDRDSPAVRLWIYNLDTRSVLPLAAE